MTQKQIHPEGAWQIAAAVNAVEEGEVVGCEVGGREIAIYQMDGTYYATSNICTHADALLSDGVVEDGEIECPLHNGRFDIKTGKACSSPAEIDIEVFRTRVIEGQVEIFIPK